MKSLFETPLGIEIETALAHKHTLAVLSVADSVLETAAEKPTADFVDGPITWSNELVNHVIEFKVTQPQILSDQIAKDFHRSMKKCSHIVRDTYNGILLPTGTHPFMNPATETNIWPGQYHEHYMAYHTIFNCYTHGFANLQSVHINIPFHTEDEFAQLFAAIRLVLPLIPALAASSPILEGKITGFLDSRLKVYSENQKKVDSVTGKIIPESIYTFQGYKQDILQKMYTDIAPHDPEKILQTEQLNSRGCIARFDRNTLEIRLIDAQESPLADIAIAGAVVFLVNELLNERWMSLADQKIVDTELLYAILKQTIETGEQTTLSEKEYLQHFGITAPTTMQSLLQTVLQPYIDKLAKEQSSFAPVLTTNLQQGPLARRILAKLSQNPSQEEIKTLYLKLAECYHTNTFFGL